MEISNDFMALMFQGTSVQKVADGVKAEERQNTTDDKGHDIPGSGVSPK